MKQKLLILFLILTISALPLFSAESVFKKGGIYVTPKVALYTWAFNFGLNVEYALTENIGIGGDVMFAFWSQKVTVSPITYSVKNTNITPAAFVSYHFTQINVEKLDVFAALYLGYAIASWDAPSVTIGNATWTLLGWDSGESSFYLNPTVGARYFFTEKIAGYMNLAFAVLGAQTGFGGSVGVSFAL